MIQNIYQQRMILLLLRLTDIFFTVTLFTVLCFVFFTAVFFWQFDTKQPQLQQSHRDISLEQESKKKKRE